MRDTDPLILIDRHEARKGEECALAKALLEGKFKTVIKDAKACKKYLGLDKYEPWGDYLILFPPNSPIHPGGALIGIERKTTLDAWGRITDGTFNGQVAELIGRTEGRTILLHEHSDYVPAALVRGILRTKARSISKAQNRRALATIKLAVATKLNKLDFALVRWEIHNTDQAIRHIQALCEEGWNYCIEGRGVRVMRTGTKVRIKRDNGEGEEDP